MGESVTGESRRHRFHAVTRRFLNGLDDHSEPIRQTLVLGMVGLVLFSSYGLFVPSSLRCALPGEVGCPGGVLGGPRIVHAAGSQWFDITAYDYGFWIVDTVSGQNESNSWNLYEGYTINVNATSLPPDSSVGGVNMHGIGISISGAGTVMNLGAPVGSWASAIFTAPTSPSSGNEIYCTIYCGPGHSSQYANVVNVVAPPILPIAKATATPTSGNSPLTVTFSGSATSGTPPYTYSWSYGDGSAMSTAQNPVHVYNSSGTYAAKLTVTDSASQVGAASVSITVTSPSPVSASAQGTPTTGSAPLTVAFSGSGSGGSPPYTYAWAFGDGSLGSGASASHTYTTAGSYTAVLTVSDSAGGSATANVAITVTGPAPPLSVNATASPSSGVVPLTVTLTAVTSQGTAPYTATWKFGDGTSGTGMSVTHVYSTAGSYLPSVTVTDSKGRVGSASTSVSAQSNGTGPPPPLVVIVTANPTLGGTPLSVNASASISGGTGTYSSILWNFGDGATGSGNPVSHRYTTGGTFSLSVTVTDSKGTSSSNSTVVTAVGLHLIANVTPTVGDAPYNVTGAASVYGGTGPYTAVTWDWGDGTTSQGTSLNHTYGPSATGSLTVTASVTDQAGETASQVLYVLVDPPLAVNLTVNLSSHAAPSKASFRAVLSGGTGIYSSSLFWNFSDNATTRGPTTESYTYNRSGSYLVTVEANDSSGAIASAHLWVNVTPRGPGNTTQTVPTSATPPSWLGNGIGDPSDTSLALLLAMSLTVLTLVWRGPKKPAASGKDGAASPSGRPGATLRSIPP